MINPDWSQKLVNVKINFETLKERQKQLLRHSEESPNQQPGEIERGARGRVKEWQIERLKDRSQMRLSHLAPRHVNVSINIIKPYC